MRIPIKYEVMDKKNHLITFGVLNIQLGGVLKSESSATLSSDQIPDLGKAVKITYSTIEPSPIVIAIREIDIKCKKSSKVLLDIGIDLSIDSFY